ncbi:MAG: diaminopimelate epimerase [Tannerella sp.]|nr:diaminopimelate epimerase [Tannerella sp.]
MARKIAFTKMQGAGNDYIYVNTRIYPLTQPEELARRWSAPHTGIGADGLVLIEPSETADFRMRIFNSDGSEAQMCGNASRCIGKYVYEKGLTRKELLRLETKAGIKELHLQVKDGRVESVTVDMGQPVLGAEEEIEAGGHLWKGRIASMGNPHFVIRVEQVEALDLHAFGPLIEHDPLFPERTNVEFVERLSDDELRVRVWERGSGITLACGTGACATAAVMIKAGLCHNPVRVKMDGGDLDIRWEQGSGHLFKTGPAAFVFEGETTI